MYENFYLTLQEMDKQLTQSEVSTDQIKNIDNLDVSNLSMDHADELAEQELPN